MKNLINILTLLGMLSLCSCTKIIYTDEQVLNRYKTKQQVVDKFGLPNEKIKRDATEEWLYNFTADTLSAVRTDSAVTSFGKHKKYVIFTMDKQGNVLSRQNKDVDLAERQKAPGRTIALVAVSAVALFLIIASAVTLNDLANF